MRDDLAEQVLATVMGWEAGQVAPFGMQLQMLAAHKYDSYEGYRPGVKFLENLGAWLHQFESVEDRQTTLRFVLEDLIFVSAAELDHLIETVYPDFIRPMIIRKAAVELGVSPFAVNRIVQDDTFRALHRKLLVLGLSDGARIDRLRRSSPPLSHEQIFLATDVGDETAAEAVTNLRSTLDNGEARFEHIVLVDDFYGSGYTLLRENDKAGEEPFKGRLWRTNKRLEVLKEREVIAADATVSILVYIASADARAHVEAVLDEAGLEWTLAVVLPLDADLKVDGEALARLCDWHYDDVLIDESKPQRYPLGYRGGALPLVLPHNTPNNSICILWADTTDREESELKRRALFPRFERHRVDRR